MVGFLLPILLLLAVSLVVVSLLRRGSAKNGAPSSGDGADVLVYLLMAVAVGVLAFSMASLGQAAFPGGAFVFDPESQVATALAGIVVSGPFAVYLWRRQRARRMLNPNAPGWTVYLSLIEAVFMTGFVFALFSVLDWLMSEGTQPGVTDVLVFGAVVVFHELAVRATPAMSDAGELPRVIGSAIGIIPLIIGLVGILHWGLGGLYESMAEGADVGGGLAPMTSLALIATGLPVWWYRWLRPWGQPAGGPRNAWTFLAATGGLVVALGAGTTLTAQALVYLLTDSSDAGAHFELVPITVAIGVVAMLVWLHHRRLLGGERTDPVRAYEYMSAAFGLTACVAASTALVASAFAPSSFVGSNGTAAIVSGVVLIVGLAVWLRFWSRAQSAPRGIEASGAPRRAYLLGLGVVMSLVGAGALIATLVGVFRAVLGVAELPATFVTTLTLFLTAGGAAWHLLRTNARDRDVVVSKDTIVPFDVTIVTSHPGMLSARLPKQARVRVIYRADGHGVIDDSMADQIVRAIDAKSSIVWIDEDGFRVAPAR